MRTSLASTVTAVVLATTAMGCSGGNTKHGAAPAPSASTTTTAPKAGARTAKILCPPKAPTAVPHHQRPGTAQELVPGSPTALLACRYHGFNQPQAIGTFARAARVPAGAIADELNATPRQKPGAIFNCPNDAGETYSLYFSYAAGPLLLVRLSHGGCTSVTNGDLTLVFPPESVTLRLVAALGEDPV